MMVIEERRFFQSPRFLHLYNFTRNISLLALLDEQPDLVDRPRRNRIICSLMLHIILMRDSLPC